MHHGDDHHDGVLEAEQLCGRAMLHRDEDVLHVCGESPGREWDVCVFLRHTPLSPGQPGPSGSGPGNQRVPYEIRGSR